jgi:hypothetical protein
VEGQGDGKEVGNSGWERRRREVSALRLNNRPQTKGMKPNGNRKLRIMPSVVRKS